MASAPRGWPRPHGSAAAGPLSPRWVRAQHRQLDLDLRRVRPALAGDGRTHSDTALYILLVILHTEYIQNIQGGGGGAG
jgi:hypothetical protein